MINWKSKKWIIPVILVAGITLILGSGILAGHKRQPDVPESAVSVKVSEAQYVDIVPSLSFNGTLEGKTSAAVSAKISGRIKEVLVQEGQQVKSGDPLVKLETVELANTVRQAGDSVRKVQASYDLALNDLTRYQTLYEKGAVSEQQLDNAKVKMRTAEADLSSAKANLSSAQEQYSYGVIVAPVDGVVANKAATIGQVVSPGATLMVVQDINQVYAVINVEQKYLGQVKTGQPASIGIDAYPDKEFSGTVDVMNPEAGTASRMFRTKIIIDNAAHELKPGMFANVSLTTGKSAQALSIPQPAIVQKQGVYHVFVLEDSKAVRRPVEIGDVSGNTVIVNSGLAAGEKVITTGVNRLKDGENVRAIQ